MTLQAARRVHFVGIGGAGMSAIAKVLAERGVAVSGSDLKKSSVVNVLQAMGAEIGIGHDAALVDGADAVVISAAIPETNPELIRAREVGLPVLSRGEALASILVGSRSIIVAGTHGKTSTTSMIVSILRTAGRDVTYLVGGGLNDSGTNAKSGRDEIAVAESDESDGSFLLLEPFVGVVTNVELDHVDRWPNLDELRNAFEEFAGSIDPDGSAIMPADDSTLAAAAQRKGVKVVTFGGDGDVSVADLELSIEAARFRVVTPDGEAQVVLSVPGLHNVTNALAAAAAALAVGLTLDEVVRGLATYRGVERRFHVRGQAGGITVIDDYAHHPTEVSATLAAARTGPWDRIVAVFQPHRYTRTAALYADFARAFSDADRVVVTDVYGAGEEPVPGITGKLVADAISETYWGRPVAYFPHRSELVAYLRQILRPGDALLTLGAGDISTMGEELLLSLKDAA